jgi:hypothetical protein
MHDRFMTHNCWSADLTDFLQVWLGAFEFALQQANRAEAAAEEADGNEEADASKLTAATAGSGTAGAAAAAPRLVLERALKSLPRHKHIKALTR